MYVEDVVRICLIKEENELKLTLQTKTIPKTSK